MIDIILKVTGSLFFIVLIAYFYSEYRHKSDFMRIILRESKVKMWGKILLYERVGIIVLGVAFIILVVIGSKLGGKPQ